MNLNFSAGMNVTDLNGDGHLDVIGIDYHSFDLSVVLGNGDGTFGPPQPYATAKYNPLLGALGDFNADGRADLAVTHIEGGVSVLLGNGDGSFGTAVLYDDTDHFGFANVAVGDFNDDDRQDLLVVSEGHLSTCWPATATAASARRRSCRDTD